MAVVHYQASLGKSIDDFIEQIDVRWFSGHDLVANQHRDHTHLDVGFDTESKIAVLSYKGSSHGDELVLIGNYETISSLRRFMEERTKSQLTKTQVRYN